MKQVIFCFLVLLGEKMKWICVWVVGCLVAGYAEEGMKVGVIGGGLAGLTAAYRLEQKGYD